MEVYTTFGIWSMTQHWTLALGLPKHDLGRPLPGPLFRDNINNAYTMIHVSLYVYQLGFSMYPAILQGKAVQRKKKIWRNIFYLYVP